MLGPKRFDRIASGLAMTITLLMGSTVRTWGPRPSLSGPDKSATCGLW